MARPSNPPEKPAHDLMGEIRVARGGKVAMTVRYYDFAALNVATTNIVEAIARLSADESSIPAEIWVNGPGWNVADWTLFAAFNVEDVPDGEEFPFGREQE